MFWFDYHWQIQQLLNHWWWPLNIVLVLGLGILVYLGHRRPALAVGATIALLPTYLVRSTIGFIPVTYLELAVLATTIGWLGHWLQNKTPVPLRAYRWPILLIITASMIGVIISPTPIAAAGLWKAYVVEPILFALVVSSVAQTANGRRAILVGLGISTIPVALLAIYQYFTGFAIAEPGWTALTHRRATSIFTSPNAVGLYLAPIIVLYGAWLKKNKGAMIALWPKIVIMLLGLGAIACTRSQGTWLGLVGAAMVMMLLIRPNRIINHGLKIGALFFLALPLIALLVTTPTTLPTDLINRLTLWHIAFNALTASPISFILGRGILGFAQIQNVVRDPLTLEALLYPHTNLFNFWLEFGLAGLVGFVWLSIKMIRHAYSAVTTDQRWLGLGVLMALTTIIVHGSIDVPYFKNDVAILFWTLIALASTLRQPEVA